MVNTCGRYFSLAKFKLIELLEKLIATETEVCVVLYTNPGNYVEITNMVGLTTYQKEPLKRSSCFQQHRRKFGFRLMYFLVGKLL